VLDYLDDLESDFSVFHRVDDMYSLGAPEFFRKAHRIGAYQGVVRLRVEAEAQRREEAPEAVTPEVVAADPGMSDLFEFG
jgi:hypothetical protein